MFNKDEHETWRLLFSQLDECRTSMTHHLFCNGVKTLQLNESEIPNLSTINKKLAERTGWEGVFAQGFIKANDFFQMLANKKFPIGNFIRSKEDLNYTPAPDIFHDLYGHLPFFTDNRFADFCQRFGKSAESHAKTQNQIDQYDRLFWFGVEFPLMIQKDRTVIFGGGILSSVKESNYALSQGPSIRNFDLESIRHHAFSIDRLQDILYRLSDEEELYSCLPRFERLVAAGSI